MAETQGRFGGGETYHYYESSKEFDFTELLEQLDHRSEHPIAGDRRIGAFCVWLGAAIRDESVDAEEVKIDTLNHLYNKDSPNTRNISHEQAWNRYMRAMVKQALKEEYASRERPRFPRRFDQPKAWAKLHDWIWSDDDRQQEFLTDLLTRTVQSNIPQRYAAVKLVARLFQEFDGRFTDEPIRILDIAAAQNLGLNKLAYGNPFSHIDVQTKADQMGERRQDRIARRHMNRLLEDELDIGPSLGLDIVPKWDRGAKYWSVACSLYPSELLNRGLRRELQMLKEQTHPNVEFIVGDITDPNLPDKLDLPPKSFHIVNRSALDYLLVPEQRAAAEANADYYVREDGVKILSDWARVNEQTGEVDEQADDIVYEESIYSSDWLYHTIVTDMRSQQPKPVEFFGFKNARCTAMELKAGALAISNLGEHSAGIRRFSKARTTNQLA